MIFSALNDLDTKDSFEPLLPYEQYSCLLDGLYVAVSEKLPGLHCIVHSSRFDENQLCVRFNNDAENLNCLKKQIEKFWSESKISLPKDCKVHTVYCPEKYSHGHLKNKECHALAFAVEIEDKFLDYGAFLVFCHQHSIKTVPVLYIGIYNDNAIRMCFTEKSAFSKIEKVDQIAINPLKELRYKEQRVVLKYTKLQANETGIAINKGGKVCTT